MEFLQKSRLEILFIIVGSFCSVFNWERADIWLQIGLGKSLQCHLHANATYDNGVCATTLVDNAVATPNHGLWLELSVGVLCDPM